jgi:hypothetical protein
MMTTIPQFSAKKVAYQSIAEHLYNLLSMNIGLVNILLMTPSLHLSETAVRMDGHGKISVSFLIKPQELFLCGSVDPVTEGFFRFASLPTKTLGFTPCAIFPAHIVDFGFFRL